MTEEKPRRFNVEYNVVPFSIWKRLKRVKAILSCACMDSLEILRKRTEHVSTHIFIDPDSLEYETASFEETIMRSPSFCMYDINNNTKEAPEPIKEDLQVKMPWG